MPKLKDEWNILNLNYLSAFERQCYINYFRSQDDIVWCECPQENVIKWRYRNG